MVKRLGVALVAGLAFVATPALAASPIIKPVGDGFWCHGSHRQITCAGAVPQLGALRVHVGRFKADDRRFGDHVRIRNISYKACSSAPSGKTRCVPRRTQRTPTGRDAKLTEDTFRFNSAFPHRAPGIYKLTFRRDGKQWGQTVRLMLTPATGFTPLRAPRSAGR